MKKIILAIILILLIGCESEKDYLSVNIVSIQNNESTSIITYSVSNESDFDIDANVILNIDGTSLIGWESLCKTYQAKSNQTFIYEATGFVYFVTPKIKLCK